MWEVTLLNRIDIVLNLHPSYIAFFFNFKSHKKRRWGTPHYLKIIFRGPCFYNIFWGTQRYYVINKGVLSGEECRSADEVWMYDINALIKSREWRGGLHERPSVFSSFRSLSLSCKPAENLILSISLSTQPQTKSVLEVGCPLFWSEDCWSPRKEEVKSLLISSWKSEACADGKYW